MTPEHKLMSEIKLWCGQHDYECFHVNVGKVKLSDGRWFDTGIPKGASDLWIFTNNGKTIFCETKVHPRKPTLEQLNFIEQQKKRGFVAFVCYSLQEFINNVECK